MSENKKQQDHKVYNSYLVTSVLTSKIKGKKDIQKFERDVVKITYPLNDSSSFLRFEKDFTKYKNPDNNKHLEVMIIAYTLLETSVEYINKEDKEVEKT